MFSSVFGNMAQRQSYTRRSGGAAGSHNTDEEVFHDASDRMNDRDHFHEMLCKGKAGLAQKMVNNHLLENASNAPQDDTDQKPDRTKMLSLLATDAVKNFYTQNRDGGLLVESDKQSVENFINCLHKLVSYMDILLRAEQMRPDSWKIIRRNNEVYRDFISTFYDHDAIFEAMGYDCGPLEYKYKQPQVDEALTGKIRNLSSDIFFLRSYMEVLISSDTKTQVGAVLTRQVIDEVCFICGKPAICYGCKEPNCQDKAWCEGCDNMWHVNNIDRCDHSYSKGIAAKPVQPKFEPVQPKFEPVQPKFKPVQPKFEPVQPKFEPPPPQAPEPQRPRPPQKSYRGRGRAFSQHRPQESRPGSQESRPDAQGMRPGAQGPRPGKPSPDVRPKPTSSQQINHRFSAAETKPVPQRVSLQEAPTVDPMARQIKAAHAHGVPTRTAQQLQAQPISQPLAKPQVREPPTADSFHPRVRDNEILLAWNCISEGCKTAKTIKEYNKSIDDIDKFLQRYKGEVSIENHNKLMKTQRDLKERRARITNKQNQSVPNQPPAQTRPDSFVPPQPRLPGSDTQVQSVAKKTVVERKPEVCDSYRTADSRVPAETRSGISANPKSAPPPSQTQIQPVYEEPIEENEAQLFEPLERIFEAISSGFSMDEVCLAFKLQLAYNDMPTFLNQNYQAFLQELKDRVYKRGNFSASNQELRDAVVYIADKDPDNLRLMKYEVFEDELIKRRQKMVQDVYQAYEGDVSTDLINEAVALCNADFDSVLDYINAEIMQPIYESIWKQPDESQLVKLENGRTVLKDAIEFVANVNNASIERQILMMGEIQLDELRSNAALILFDDEDIRSRLEEEDRTIESTDIINAVLEKICPDPADCYEKAKRYLSHKCVGCMFKYPLDRMANFICHDTNETDYCRDCALSYFESKLKNEMGILCIKCPVCGAPDFKDPSKTHDYFVMLSQTTFKNIGLSPDCIDVFDQRVIDNKISADACAVQCCNDTCVNIFYVEEGYLAVQCDKCGYHQCWKCKSRWEKEHEDQNCEEFAKLMKDKQESQASNAVIGNMDIMTCPGSGCAYQYALLRGGCAHMTCHACKYQFCPGCDCEYSKNEAVHEWNCFAELRDVETNVLEQFLKRKGIEIAGESADFCVVYVTEDNNVAIDQETPCGKPAYTSTKYCEGHYRAYLIKLINDKKLNPVELSYPEDAKKTITKLRKYFQKHGVEYEFASIDKDVDFIETKMSAVEEAILWKMYNLLKEKCSMKDLSGRPLMHITLNTTPEFD